MKFLEGSLIRLAEDANQAKLMNAQSSQASLPESDETEMAVFLQKALQLMPVIGLDAFKKTGRTSPGSPKLYCKIKGLIATGRRTSSGFVVHKGSQAVPKDRIAAKSAAPHRKRLLEKGVLVANDKCLVFTSDYEFTSPSATGAVVRGGNTNGLIQWRNEDLNIPDGHELIRRS